MLPLPSQAEGTLEQTVASELCEASELCADTSRYNAMERRPRLWKRCRLRRMTLRSSSLSRGRPRRWSVKVPVRRCIAIVSASTARSGWCSLRGAPGASIAVDGGATVSNVSPAVSSRTGPRKQAPEQDRARACMLCIMSESEAETGLDY
eukprot:scaffold36973_cov54-Phaeocystis_antarctica.AAC.4